MENAVTPVYLAAKRVISTYSNTSFVKLEGL